MSDANVYYSPSACGLRIFDELEEQGLSYEFNQAVVFEDLNTKRLFWGRSAGCSCPTPYEEYYFRGPAETNLEEITPVTLESFQRQVDAFPAPQDEREAMIAEVKRHLNG